MTETVQATAKLLPATPRRMSIANIIRGPVIKPMRVLVYGVDGIGKTTFAASAPGAVFIGVEDGTSTLDAPRYPQPKDWRDTLDALDDLATAAHDFHNVVIDTLDWLEPMCWARIVANTPRTREGKVITAIEDIPFGRGFNAALDEWRVLLAKLDRLRSERSMGVVLVAHSWIKSFKNPEGEDFDRYEMKLHKSASSLVREWADAVLFATHETYVNQKNKQARAKGVSTGARVLHTTRTAAWDAKNRHDLPETLPLDWQAFEEAVAARQTASPETIRTRITALLEGADDALKGRVAVAVTRAADNASELARIANKLAAQITIKENQEPQS